MGRGEPRQAIRVVTARQDRWYHFPQQENAGAGSGKDRNEAERNRHGARNGVRSLSILAQDLHPARVRGGNGSCRQSVRN